MNETALILIGGEIIGKPQIARLRCGARYARWDPCVNMEHTELLMSWWILNFMGQICILYEQGKVTCSFVVDGHPVALGEGDTLPMAITETFIKACVK